MTTTLRRYCLGDSLRCAMKLEPTLLTGTIILGDSSQSTAHQSIIDVDSSEMGICLLRCFHTSEPDDSTFLPRYLTRMSHYLI